MTKKNYLKAFAKIARENPELAEAVNWLKDYKARMENGMKKLSSENKKIKEDIEMINNLVGFYIHEAKTPLNAIYGFCGYILRYGDNLDEEQIKNLENMKTSAEKAISLTNIDKRIFSEKEKFSVFDVVKTNILRQEELIRKNKLGLNFRYTPVEEIESNKALIDGVIGTILDDAYCWTPDYSRVEVGIRKDKGSKTEILIENKIAEKRRNICGEGKGIGQKSAKGFIKKMGYEFHNYSKPEIIYNANKNRYETTKNLGNERATDNISLEDVIWGIKIRI